MSSSILDQFVNRSRKLYSLPAVAMRVVELTDQPAIDTQSLKECIENDPALAAKILRVVNSSLFGLSPRVTDLNQALALLGTKTLKLLVLGFSLPDELLTGLEANVLHRYWRRTVIKATAARELAETLWRIPGDDAFIAGLLQDLGMLVLIQDLGDTYLSFIERIHHDGGTLLAFEAATLGFDHAILSARLLEQWGLPASIVRDVSRPFDADTLVSLPSREQAVPQILHLADLVAEFLTRQRVSVLNELIDAGGRYQNISMEQIEPLIASLELKVPQLAEILSLSLPHETAYSTILARAYAQLGDAAEAAGRDLLGREQPGAPAGASQLGELMEQTQTLCREIGQFTESRSGSRFSNGFTGSEAAMVARGDLDLASDDDERRRTALASDHGLAPTLPASIEAAVKSCRQARHALSLILLEPDYSDPVWTQRGIPQVRCLTDRLQSIMKALVGRDGQWIQVADSRFAVLLEGCDRQPAVELARRLVRCTREWGAEQATIGGRTVSLSAGVATLAMPPQNFPAHELIQAADRCLHGVQLSGGDSVKSIDI